MPSPTERWADLKSLFAAIVDLPMEERASAVESACRGDVALQQDLESLLAADDRAASFLASPIEEIEWPMPRSIGAYQIVREIGSGGMGTVYLAESDDEFRRQVAIKVIRGRLAADHVLKRFRLERRILAQLDHPNIARFLDGGTTAEGLPYFVMEYVDGVTIDVYCAERALSVNERLLLLLPICAAVQFAHQSLIIHRDIKPANILITPDGSPRLLDFGIAKVLDESDPHSTVTGAGALTPAYASPEHMRGLPLTTASDVYSLGVVLFELLAGERPYCDAELRMAARTGDDESEPPRPSKVSAAPASLGRRLRGDIDTIVMTALWRDPARRYGSATAFAEDIRRHLEGRPVAARPATLRYRTGKFIRRNRARVLAAVVIVAVVLGGMIATVRQARIAERERQRAERRAADVRRLSTDLLFELHDAIGPLPGSIAARQLLVTRALRYLDGLSSEMSDDADLKMELATAYDRVGSLTFDLKKAQSSYQKALALGRQVVRSDPGNGDHAIALLSILGNTGDLFKMMGQTVEASTFAEEALALSRKLVRLNPEDARYWSQLDLAHHRFGFVLQDAGIHDQALQHYREALSAAERAAHLAPDNLYYRRRTMVESSYIGINLAALGRYEEAIVAFGVADAALAPLTATDPVNATYRRDLWNIDLHRGLARLGTGQLADAFGDLGRALRIKEYLVAADPGDTGHRRGLAVTHLAFGQACDSTDARRNEAMAHYEEAMRLSESLTSVDSLNYESRMDVGRIERSIAAHLIATGRSEAARVHLLRGKAVFEQCSAMSRGNPSASEQLRAVRQALAEPSS